MPAIFHTVAPWDEQVTFDITSCCHQKVQDETCFEKAQLCLQYPDNATKNQRAFPRCLTQNSHTNHPTWQGSYRLRTWWGQIKGSHPSTLPMSYMRHRHVGEACSHDKQVSYRRALLPYFNCCHWLTCIYEAIQTLWRQMFVQQVRFSVHRAHAVSYTHLTLPTSDGV